MPSICHFEVSAEDIERAKRFYNKVFDWKFEKDANMDYWMISTTDSEGKPGLGGGLMKRENFPAGIMNYIDVNNIAETLKKIEKEGGKILVPQSPITNVGYFAVFMDTEQNTFCLFKEDMKAK